MKPPAKLARNQINRRLRKLQGFAEYTQIRTGWINYMRQAMCLTLSKLAELSKLSTATVQQTEKRELMGKVTLQTMSKIASAMDCEFIYAIVPKEDLSSYLRNKAIEKATKIVIEADTHMTLEDQRVSNDIKTRIQRISDDLLERGDIW